MINNKILGLITLALVLMVGAMPVFAADTDSSTQAVQVTVGPTVAIQAIWNSGLDNNTITLGPLAADNVQNIFTGGATGEQIFTFSNVKIDVYTKIAGDLTDATNTTRKIAASNFLYSGGSVGTATAFTDNYAILYDDWDKAPKYGNNSAPINLYLTVPFGTDEGTYSSTVYFSAVRHNAGAPTTP